MMKIPWDDGECSECGDKMLFAPSFSDHNECKACKMLAAIERIAYALELRVGIE